MAYTLAREMAIKSSGIDKLTVSNRQKPRLGTPILPLPFPKTQKLAVGNIGSFRLTPNVCLG